MASATLDVSTPTDRSKLDIPFQVVLELFIKRTMAEDTVTTTRISDATGICGAVISPAFDILRERKYLDVKSLQGNDYVFSLTTLGRDYARDLNEQCRYNGIAPVAIESYTTAVLLQRAQMKVNQTSMANAMSDLVVAPEMLAQLGPAFNSQHSIFFYGPAGTGKTSLAERLVRLYGDWIILPHAVLVDGQYILMYDPTVHEPLPEQPATLDRRWVACKRPLVTVGGELERDMLRLMYDPVGRVYTAPIQVKANNGMMLIDDFGRQELTPQQLLNRWIYPLSKRVDYFTLANGTKFAMPFELMVAFSTNMDPNDLGDEAFFRRIKNKVYVGPVTDEMFDRILVMAGRHLNIELLPESAAWLKGLCKRRDAIGLRANYPIDIGKMIVSICEYEERASVFDELTMLQAADLYWGTSENAKLDVRPADRARELALR